MVQHVKDPLLLMHFNQIKMYQKLFRKLPNIKLHKRSISSFWVPTHKQTQCKANKHIPTQIDTMQSQQTHFKIFIVNTPQKNTQQTLKTDTLTVFSGLISTYCSCSQGSLFAPCHQRYSPRTLTDPVCKPQYQAVPLPQGEQSGLFPADLEFPHYKSQCVTHVPGTCTHKMSFVFVRLALSQPCF